jgi:hypothetical protein
MTSSDIIGSAVYGMAEKKKKKKIKEELQKGKEEKTLGKTKQNKKKRFSLKLMVGRSMPREENVNEQMSQPRTGYVRVISKRESIPQRPPAALLCARYILYTHTTTTTTSSLNN